MTAVRARVRRGASSVYFLCRAACASWYLRTRAGIISRLTCACSLYSIENSPLPCACAARARHGTGTAHGERASAGGLTCVAERSSVEKPNIWLSGTAASITTDASIVSEPCI